MGGENLYAFAPNANEWIDPFGLKLTRKQRQALGRESWLKGYNAECIAQMLFGFEKNNSVIPSILGNGKNHIPDGWTANRIYEVKHTGRLRATAQIRTFMSQSKPLLIIADKRTKIDSRISQNPNTKIRRLSFDRWIAREAKKQGKCPNTDRLC